MPTLAANALFGVLAGTAVLVWSRGRSNEWATTLAVLSTATWLALSRDADSLMPVALAGVAVATRMGTVWRWLVATVASALLATTVGGGSDRYTWLSCLWMLLAVSVAPVVRSHLWATLPGIALAVAVAVPDTESAFALVGLTIPFAAAAVWSGRFEIARTEVRVVVAFAAWVVANGSRGRMVTFIPGFGALTIAAIGSLLAARLARRRARLPIVGIAVACTALAVALARTAGLSTDRDEVSLQTIAFVSFAAVASAVTGVGVRSGQAARL